jgi:hypothetical protein
MLKKFVSIMLLICMAAQSPLVASQSVHDSLHDASTAIHDYFHDIGQPHEHNEIDAQKFEISYSKNALEHNNSHHDGGVVGIFILLPSGIPNILPDVSLDNILVWWASPFIKYATRPPKI